MTERAKMMRREDNATSKYADREQFGESDHVARKEPENDDGGEDNAKVLTTTRVANVMVTLATPMALLMC